MSPCTVPRFLLSLQPHRLSSMDNEETVGSTTDALLAAISHARTLYCAMYSPGSVSTHHAKVHQQKFVTENQSKPDAIYCSSQPKDDLPLAQVKERLKDLGAKRVNSLGPGSMGVFNRYKEEVQKYSKLQNLCEFKNDYQL